MENKEEQRLRLYNDNKVSGIIIKEIGSEICHPLHSFGPAVREHYLFHLVESGNGFFHYSDKKVRVSERQIFMIKPGEITFYQASEGSPWKYYWFGIDGVGALALTKLMGFTDDVRIVTQENTFCDLVARFDQFVARRILKRSDQLLEMSDFYYIVSLICKNAERDNDATCEETSEKGHMPAIVEYINKNYLRPIKISDVANHIGIDRTQLFRLFKEAIGIGPQDYLIAMRMQKAAELLSSTDLPIQIIACSVGYLDPYHFSKLFKKKKGRSPSEFRLLFKNI